MTKFHVMTIIALTFLMSYAVILPAVAEDNNDDLLTATTQVSEPAGTVEPNEDGILITSDNAPAGFKYVAVPVNASVGKFWGVIVATSAQWFQYIVLSVGAVLGLVGTSSVFANFIKPNSKIGKVIHIAAANIKTAK